MLGLGVNLVSAFLLHDDEHHHGHGHAGTTMTTMIMTTMTIDHDHAGHHDHSHHADHNFRAAYIHVLSDALTSVFAIAALSAAAYFDLHWLDPIAGLLGMIVITIWAYSLIRSAAAVLLDAVPSRARAELIRQRLETGGDRVTDLHVWRLGPGHLGVLASIVSKSPQPPSHYKARLDGIDDLSHVTIEVNPYDDRRAARYHEDGAAPRHRGHRSLTMRPVRLPPFSTGESGPMNVITLASRKGGVGKSTLTAHLAGLCPPRRIPRRWWSMPTRRAR